MAWGTGPSYSPSPFVVTFLHFCGCPVVSSSCWSFSRDEQYVCLLLGCETLQGGEESQLYLCLQHREPGLYPATQASEDWGNTKKMGEDSESVSLVICHCRTTLQVCKWSPFSGPARHMQDSIDQCAVTKTASIQSLPLLQI